MKKAALKMSKAGILFFFALIVFPRILGAADSTLEKSNGEPPPLGILVGENGGVVLFDGKKLVGTVTPAVFTEGWAFHWFRGANPYPPTRWETQLPGGGKVALQASVQVLKQGVHIRYSMTPSQAVSVLSLRAHMEFPYADWQGGPYQLGESSGTLPPDKSDKVFHAEGNGVSLSLGPSSAHSGLILKMQDKDLQTTLMDGRNWGSSLFVFFTHGEPTDDDKPWAWEAGKSKDFDFTLSFNRPTTQVFMQGPRRPFPFRDENVSFVNPQAGVTLQGTLALPQRKGPFPAVELLQGSGPHTRDGYYDNNYFLVLTDYLTSRGLAVLRYDKRGMGESSGDYDASTSQNFADDAACGVEFLKGRNDIDAHKIGLVGHSEGGTIAPLVAAHSKDVAFIVVMSGTGVRGDRNQILQRETADKQEKFDPKELRARRKIVTRIVAEAVQEPDDGKVLSKVKAIVGEEMASLSKKDPGALTDEQAFWEGYTKTTLLTKWARFFDLYNPQTSLKKVTCPILAIAGDKDRNVPPDENFAAIGKALRAGKNKDYTLKLFPNLGHTLNEYKADGYFESADPLQVIAPVVLETLGDWIEKHVKN